MQKSIYLLLIAIIVCFSCQKSNEDNVLSNTEKEQGWELLFNGKNTQNWHLYNLGKPDSASWFVQNSELVVSTDSMGIVHGDLVSDKIYENFELVFDWKISKAGNSGVFLNVNEKDSIPTAWASGPEYQLLDHQNIGPEYLANTTKHAGCLYGFKDQKTKVTPKASPEWNHSRISQDHGKIRFYLNDTLTAQEDFSALAWKKLAAASNLAKVHRDFGQSTKGHIVLQEWAKGVSFKNIKIKPLP